jgi:hypothetical protein
MPQARPTGTPSSRTETIRMREDTTSHRACDDAIIHRRSPTNNNTRVLRATRSDRIALPLLACSV